MNQFNNERDDDESEINLDLLGIVKRRFHLIVLGIFVGATLATIFYVKQVPVYESSFAVLVGQRSADINTGSMGKILDGATTTQDGILETHIELIRSPRVLQDAINEGSLQVDLGQIRKELKIAKSESGASLLTASYRDTDPDRAANVLHAVYESYRRYIGNQSRSIGTEAAELIANAQVRNEVAVREADEAYRKFVASVPAMITADQNGGASIKDIHQVRLAKLESELSDVRRTLANLRSRKSAIQSFVRGRNPEEIEDTEVLAILSEEEINRLQTFVTVFSEPTIQDLNDVENRQLAETLNQETRRIEYGQMLELSSRLNLMKSTFGSGHPSVKTIEDEMELLERRVARFRKEKPKAEELLTGPKRVSTVEMLAHYFNVIQSDIAGYATREQELVRLSEKESRLAKEVQMTFMKGSSLKATLDRARSRYDQVFQRLQEINLTNDYAGFSTDLLVAPAPAMFPVWPAKAKIAAMGLMGGAMLGFALAMLAEMADRTFRDPSEVEQVVGATILAHVPRMVEAKLARKTKPDSLVSPMIPAFHLPRGSESETFRVLRTSVLLQSKSAGKKVIMMTSPSPSDGKSTTIANLAVSIAQTGKKVLLVDGDMRRPTVAKNFGLDPSTGLVDFLTGEERFQDCLHPSEQTDLTICPRGARTSAPAELLESPQFVDFVRHAREEFDIVLIDAPPLLAVTDPAIIAEHADSCLITIRIEKNNRTLVQRAAEILSEQGKPIDGIIVNSRDSRANAYGYSSYNYYGKKEHGYLAKYRDYYASDDADDDSPKKKRTRRSSSRKSGSAETRSAETRSPESGGAFNKAKTPAANGHVRNGVLPGSKQESEAGSVASGRVEAGRVSES